MPFRAIRDETHRHERHIVPGKLPSNGPTRRVLRNIGGPAKASLGTMTAPVPSPIKVGGDTLLLLSPPERRALRRSSGRPHSARQERRRIKAQKASIRRKARLLAAES